MYISKQESNTKKNASSKQKCVNTIIRYAGPQCNGAIPQLSKRYNYNKAERPSGKQPPSEREKLQPIWPGHPLRLLRVRNKKIIVQPPICTPIRPPRVECRPSTPTRRGNRGHSTTDLESSLARRWSGLVWLHAFARRLRLAQCPTGRFTAVGLSNLEVAGEVRTDYLGYKVLSGECCMR